MYSFEELIEIDQEDFDSLPRFRDNTAVISSSDNVLLVHTNIFGLKNLMVEAEKDSVTVNLQQDVSKIAHKLTSSKIMMIKCEILDPRIQLTVKEVQAFNSNV